jgi:crossover junction endodeoxyribonuclease RuvC
MRTLGIDPGGTGALCLLENGLIVAMHDMPTVTEIVSGKPKERVEPGLVASIIRDMGHIDMAYVERVSAMPKQGIASTFVFGRSAGIIEGVLAGLQVPVKLILPGRWKKAAGFPAKASKDASRQMAVKLWPGDAALFKLAKWDGRAEAALMARFGGLV